MAKKKDAMQAKLDRLTADLMKKIGPMFTPSERRIIVGGSDMDTAIDPDPPKKPKKEGPYIQTWLPHRVWQYREVIRHHTFRALLRRIPRHVHRLLKEHRFRDGTYWERD